MSRPRTKNTATAKQCQVVLVTFIATECFFQLKENLKGFSILAPRATRSGSVKPNR